MDLPVDADSVENREGRRRLTARHALKSSSWTSTRISYATHFHTWEIKGFSQTDCRYLETTFSVKESNPASTAFEPLANHTFKLRLHPQGNKSSNLEFSFFQIFSLAQNAKFKAKFYVYNSNDEEIATTIYSGAQQLNGFFQYVRRSDLLKHIENDDELRLVVSVTTYSDTVTRQGSYSKNDSEIDQQDDPLSRDYEKCFNDERFSDFKIILGERQKVLNAHRVILSARSPYFSALLSSHTKEFSTGEVIYPDVDYEVFTEMIYFLYTNKAPRIRQMALELMVLCDRFQVTRLKELAARVLKESLRTDNVCNVLIKADLHGSPELKEAAVSYIVNNSSAILKTSHWESLISDHPKIITDICIAMSSGDKQAHEPPATKRVRIG